DSLVAAFEPGKYHDAYREQVMALIRAKAEGEELTTPEVAAEKPKVVDIMAALEASVEAAKAARSRHPAQKSTGKAAAKKGAKKKAAAKKTATKKIAAKKAAKRQAAKSA
ncbi:MAG: Ku protein, partial [Actinomycetota bacterium]